MHLSFPSQWQFLSFQVKVGLEPTYIAQIMSLVTNLSYSLKKRLYYKHYLFL